MQPQIILLKEGTEASQGRSQIISNINACQAIVDCVRTTLGPRGMDKLMVEAQGKATISNDGATIMKLLDVVHPAAKTLVDIAKSQDAEVGDGTTSVVLLAGEFLKQMKPFIEEGVHSQIIIRSVRKATQLAIQHINDIAVKTKKDDPKEHRECLEKCAATAMGSKLINQQRDFFSKMVVDAVMLLDDLMPLNMIGIKKVPGGALEILCLWLELLLRKRSRTLDSKCSPNSTQAPRLHCSTLNWNSKQNETMLKFVSKRSRSTKRWLTPSVRFSMKSWRSCTLAALRLCFPNCPLVMLRLSFSLIATCSVPVVSLTKT